MSSTSKGTSGPYPGKGRSARQQRRLAQRSTARNRPPHQTKGRRGTSRTTIIGSLLTIAIVLGILGYALFHSSSGSASSGNGLTNPSALNPAASMLSQGSTAPNFTLKDANGVSHTLAAQRGHPVLLEFFATWCPVCQGEAPIMAKLTSTYTPKGVRVWSILANPYGRNFENSGQTDLRLADSGDLSWFARTFKVQHPQLIDPKYTTVNRYGINAYPGLYVIDKNGKISYVASGHEDYSVLAKQLDKALAGTA